MKLHNLDLSFRIEEIGFSCPIFPATFWWQYHQSGWSCRLWINLTRIWCFLAYLKLESQTIMETPWTSSSVLFHWNPQKIFWPLLYDFQHVPYFWQYFLKLGPLSHCELFYHWLLFDWCRSLGQLLYSASKLWSLMILTFISGLFSWLKVIRGTKKYFQVNSPIWKIFKRQFILPFCTWPSKIWDHQDAYK